MKFYDRRILGFDAGDQIQLTEAFRDSFGNAARSIQFWKGTGEGGVFPGGAKAVVVVLGLATLAILVIRDGRLGRGRLEQLQRLLLAVGGRIAGNSIPRSSSFAVFSYPRMS